MMQAHIPAIFLLAAAGCLAQTPTFDAASIRPSTHAGNELNETNDGRDQIRVSPGLLTIQGVSLRMCIQWAYEIPSAQIQGPDWLKDVGFDIVAKSAAPADEDQLRLMLRTLLAQRLGLKTHSEQKEMQVYELTLAKGGPKFHESTTEGPPLFSGNNGRLIAERVTMTDLAEKISEPLGRPVIDATGLKGRYDIHIDATAYMGQSGNGSMDVTALLFNALQQQLGVKLESRKDTPKMLVIDSVEKTPTEN
jgi:uncharacterized protein (TIGR03435 family)